MWPHGKTMKTWNISGIFIVLWPMTGKIKTCELATKPQTNWRSCLWFSFLMLDWLFFLEHNNIPEISLVFTIFPGLTVSPTFMSASTHSQDLNLHTCLEKFSWENLLKDRSFSLPFPFINSHDPSPWLYIDTGILQRELVRDGSIKWTPGARCWKGG